MMTKLVEIACEYMISYNTQYHRIRLLIIQYHNQVINKYISLKSFKVHCIQYA